MSSVGPVYNPQQGPVSGAWYTYPPYLEAIGDGQSLALPFHTPVTFPFPGTVTRATTGATGVQVDVARPDGTSYSFVHLDTLDPAIRPGAQVQAGQFAGLSGGENPGYPGAVNPASPQYSSGPHIDFDIWSGNAWASTPLPDVATSALTSLQRLGLQPLNAPSSGQDQGGTNTTGGNAIKNIFKVLDPASAFQAIGSFLNALVPWVAAPVRILKIFGGLSLIVVSLVVTFRGPIAEAGAGVVTASTGIPIATGGKGVRGAVSNAIRTGGNAAAFGTRARAKESQRQQRAYAAGRTLEAQRMERAETTRRLRANTQAATARENVFKAQRANTSRILNARVAAPVTRPIGPIATEAATRGRSAPPMQRGTAEAQRRVNSGLAGFAGFGPPDDMTPKEARRAGWLRPLTRNAKTPKVPPVQPPAVGRGAEAAKILAGPRVVPVTTKQAEVLKQGTLDEIAKRGGTQKTTKDTADEIAASVKPAGMSWEQFYDQQFGRTVVTKKPRTVGDYFRVLRLIPSPGRKRGSK